MDKKTILLDSNLIYLLADINTNDYDRKKILKLCSENECLIDLYSIFEIYNNDNLTLGEIKKIISTIINKNIKIYFNDIMSEFVNDKLNLGDVTQLNRIRVRNKLSKKIIPFYSRLFTFLSIINFHILFLFNKKPSDEYYTQLDWFLGQLFPVVYEHVDLSINKAFTENKFKEKNLKNLYASLLSSFQFTILNAEEKYSKNVVNKNDKTYFKFLLQEFKREDFMNCCMRFVMKSSKPNGDNILLNMYKLVFKPRFPSKVDADCLIDDTVNYILTKAESKVEKEWFKYMLKNLLCDEANLKTNNFIDYLIIRDLVMDNKVDYLITCDEGMQKIMNALSFNNKIKESLDVIETLK